MQHQKLKKLREEYEITQARLAEFMKVKEADIAAWENGSKEPSLAQLERLASLFDLDKTQFMNMETSEMNDAKSTTKDKDAHKNRKGKTKTKTKKKTKHKTKYKTRHKKDRKHDKKRSNVPIILFILFLVLAIGAAGGYVYWKYGDDYFLAKKSDMAWKTNDVVGTFSAEEAQGETPSQLTLKSDKTFLFQLNDCEETTSLEGTWTLQTDTITLHSGSTTYQFKINSSNALLYQSSQVRCGPVKSTVFTRGATTSAAKEEPSTLTIGSWQDEDTTLSVTSIEASTITFTLTAVNPEDNTSVAKLSNIQGTWKDGAVEFSFSDDGFGNAGTGRLTFENDNAAFTITKTDVNSDALWAIPDSKVLQRVT